MVTAKKTKPNKLRYPKFSKINGRHPLQQSCPDSFISYKVRKRHGGKITFFNFELAREMGLIAKDDQSLLNSELEKTILDTFSLVIINEYDIINDIKIVEEDVFPHTYMATRYLQLQHPNKQGKTSGDGRSIWNGQIKNRERIWDISSCGTGATRLSPATHLQNKFFKTGDPSISYGCGYSEVDEGLSTLFFSEILFRNGYETEKVLAIVEFENGLSINVRAHSNLLRPSHMFSHLKQGNLEALSNIVDFYIEQREISGHWTDIPKNKKARYHYFVAKQVEVFSKLSAHFEDDYIFCWLDWDGDNILMDGGIIDYGSIRQFGLFHQEYRYDDVSRYSTSIKEQREKAKHISKCFVQIGQYLCDGVKSPISTFNSHKQMKRFDTLFNQQKNLNLLQKIGLSKSDSACFLKKNKKIVEEFKISFSHFERAKSDEGLHKVLDGINWNAIFCMRDILRELPQLLLHRSSKITKDEFIDIIKSSYATNGDLEISSHRANHINMFQNNYVKIIEILSLLKEESYTDTLLHILMRSSIINKYDRVTGDSITNVVHRVMKRRPKLNPDELFQIVQEFSEYQNLDPDSKRTVKKRKSEHSKMMKGMLQIVRDYREGL